MNISAAKPSGIGLVSFQVINADFASARSPDNLSEEKQEITPSKGNCIPSSLAGSAPHKHWIYAALPNGLRFPCPPTAKITNTAFGLRELHFFKIPTMRLQNQLLSPQIEQMSSCPTA